jgi:hypothetical protein
MAIRKPITAVNTTRMARLGRTTQISITRTGIRNRISLIDTPTPGRTRLIVMTNIGTARGIDVTVSGSEFACDSLGESGLDTP